MDLGCPHCGQPAPATGRDRPFCCAGCREVYGLLHERGLSHYYDLAVCDRVPASSPTPDRSQAWLEPLLATAERQPGEIRSLDLDLQGLHCAACVWLINELYRRRQAGGQIVINPALGKVHLSWRKGTFDVAAFLHEVERFGYRFGPSRKTAEASSRDLPMRIGVCAAIAMNVMMFSVSFYAGLTPAEGDLFRVFVRLSYGLSAIAVLVGGWPFFKAALLGLRRGVLHLDLPIAVGILLAFTTSMLKVRQGRGDLAYFDTLDVFVTLMLVGRWLQVSVLEKNRRFLLDDEGIDGIHVRRLENGRLAVRPATAISEGDALVIAPGDLIPVDAQLQSPEGEISTDWINGESVPRSVTVGETIPAGSFNAGRSAIDVRTLTAFSNSPLPMLLRSNRGVRPAHARLTEIVSRIWVPAVLALSAIGLWIWWPRGPAQALDVTAALLIVTCPCALGIAIPLAGELAFARLRRSGIFVRSGDLLDRLLRVKRVLFDKTGTLTLGGLELSNPDVIQHLAPAERDALYDMVARSNHPVSRCIAGELATGGAQLVPASTAVEHPGQGVEMVRDGRTYRFGAASWVAPTESSEEGTAFSVDGRLVARFELRERVRHDARLEIAALRERGIDIWLVSGDSEARVQRAAIELGVEPNHLLASQRPEDKAAAVRFLDAKSSLFIGDGVNDSLAFEVAGATGTPAIDRPVIPGKADFFLLGEGIGGVRELFDTAVTLRAVMRRILLVSQAYNALAIAASLAGLMTPLRAAIAMPVSSLTVIALAIAGFAGRRAPAQGLRPHSLTAQIAQ